MKVNEQSVSKDVLLVRRARRWCARHGVPVLAACPAGEEQFGKGGHAACYKATLCTEAGQVEVVVKRLLPSRGLPRELELGEIVSEAVLLARVAGVHGVPRLHGVVLDPPALVTSFDGPCTLCQAVAQRRGTDEGVLEAVVQVCRAVKGLHARGVAHNDIKTNNVVVQELPGGRLAACLIDLGNSELLGKAIFEAGALRWEEHRFLAPELVAGGPGTTASDVFSLGHMMASLARLLKPPSEAGQLLGRLGAKATACYPAQRPPLQELTAALEEALRPGAPDSTLG